MYRCERLSLQEQEPRSPTDEWRSAAVVMATAGGKEGEEKAGYGGRKENGMKRGGEGGVLLKGPVLPLADGALGTRHITSGERRAKEQHFNITHFIFLSGSGFPLCPCFTLETVFIQLQPCFTAI